MGLLGGYTSITRRHRRIRHSWGRGDGLKGVADLSGRGDGGAEVAVDAGVWQSVTVLRLALAALGGRNAPRPESRAVIVASDIPWGRGDASGSADLLGRGDGCWGWLWMLGSSGAISDGVTPRSPSLCSVPKRGQLHLVCGVRAKQQIRLFNRVEATHMDDTSQEQRRWSKSICGLPRRGSGTATFLRGMPTSSPASSD